ncbi:hypothetical protein Tco_1407052 [Tanacetum coccineum]
MGHSGNDVPGALLHNTIAQDMRERPLNESFENDTLDLINIVTEAQRLNNLVRILNKWTKIKTKPNETEYGNGMSAKIRV